MISLLPLLLLAVRPIWAQEELCDRPKTKTEDVSHAVCLFSRPLVVGASISRGFGANAGGPGALIAEQLSPDTQITNMASSGTASVASLKDHQVPIPAPSVVMGVDLFFWDAARKKCGPDFEDKTKSFIKLYQDLKIPLILGKLPKDASFPPGYAVLDKNECTDKINKLLEEECTAEKNCLIYDPMNCFRKMKENHPKAEQLKKFFVDDLHTSVEGNRYCANVFIGAKAYQNLSCPLPK